MMKQPISFRWSSRLTIFWVISGLIFSLSDIWELPYVMHQNGGSAFLLVYMLALGVIATPVLAAEMILGRILRLDPISGMEKISKVIPKDRIGWKYIGYICAVAGLLFVSYYSVIAGWSLSYSVSFSLHLLTDMDTEASKAIFTDLISDPERMMAWQTLFLATLLATISQDNSFVIEKLLKVIMPAICVMVAAIIAISIFYTPSQGAIEKLLSPDYSKIDRDTCFLAARYAFYTLTLGTGAAVMFGSCLPRHVSIYKVAAAAVLFDLLLSLSIGIAVFSMTPADKIETAGGSDFIFITLPSIFSTMPFGQVAGALFYSVSLLAAWTTALMVIEPLVSYLERRFNIPRNQCAVWCIGIMWLLGLFCILSLTSWADITFRGLSLLELIDLLATDILRPLAAILITLFVAWFILSRSTLGVIELSSNASYRYFWYYLLKYLTPISLILIFIQLFIH